MNQLPLISVIIVNYNTSQEIRALLISLAQVNYANLEIIIVDNASPNDSLQHLAKDFSGLQIIYSPENLGFAGGNNLGLQVAKGDFLLLINPDTIIEKGAITVMLNIFRQNPMVGLVSPKIKYHKSPDTIQYAGMSAMSPWTMRTRSYGKGKKDNPEFDVSKPTFFGHGAAMMIKREVLDRVGGMEEAYFLYYEELDWCLQMRQAGFEVYYAAQATVWHKESVAVERDSPLKKYYMSRNRLLFARRHFTRWQLLVSSLYTLLVLLPKNIYTHWRRPSLLYAWWRAMLWHLSPLKQANY